jgi:hypothetical protein
MSELERYSGGGRLDRRSRKEITRAQRDEIVGRSQAEARENLAAYEADLRITNGEILTRRAQARLNNLDAHTELTAAGKPGLEMQHRQLQAAFVLAAGDIIYSYMTRPRRYG